MRLGLGLGISRLQRATGGAPPAFSPASLFTGTDTGFWANVTPSRLWQDVARTTPVTATGQTVASWELTTRTGAIYAEQATAGSRPAYQTDAEGMPFLDFAGSKWMQTPAIDGSVSDKSQLFAAYRANNTGARMLLETSTRVDNFNGTLFFLVFTPAALDNALRYLSKGTLVGTTTTAGTTPVADKRYAVGIGDISGDLAILREMGTEQSRATTDQGSGNFGNHVAYIGSRAGNADFFNDRIYSLGLRYGPNLTAGQITDLEAWLAARINP